MADVTDDPSDRAAWLEGLSFWVSDPISENVDRARAAEAVANAQAQQAHGPGFRLDRQHAEQMVSQAIQVRADLENDQRITQSLERMQPAAKDPVSVAFAQNATWNGGTAGAFAYGAGHVRLEILYLDELIKRLNTALGRTTETDHAAGKAVDASAHGGAG
ncbi:hypothetical protein AB5J62_05345 [Amycolatopsis sp. cg5]|uniref:hypothetical protein n=1 Tax=Amycolatopsis sp. cg5 TaxID=3238802 RepID=UPI003524C1CE